MNNNPPKYLGFIPGESYGRWRSAARLVHVRMVLRSIGEKNPRPFTKLWRPLYEDGLRPGAAVRLNMAAMDETQPRGGAPTPVGKEIIVPYQYYSWGMPSVK